MGRKVQKAIVTKVVGGRDWGIPAKTTVSGNVLLRGDEKGYFAVKSGPHVGWNIEPGYFRLLKVSSAR